MNTVRVVCGRLAHHFWGDYRATVALEFASEADARDAMQALERINGGPGGLAFGKTMASVIVWHGDSVGLDRLTDALVAWGLKVEPCAHKVRKSKRGKLQPCTCHLDNSIGSVAHSLDYGPPFTVAAIPVVPAEQERMFP